MPPDWNIADEGRSVPVTNVTVVTVETNLASTISSDEITDTNTYPDTWIALSSWGETNGFDPVEHIQPPSLDYSLTNNYRWRDLMLKGMTATVPLPIFLEDTRRGVLVIQSGTRLAHWNGISFYLGYAPRLAQGEVLVHSVDISKNLEPLLGTPSWTSKSNRVVVIDPGHGGADNGAKSIFDNSWEKQWTLDWALRLVPLLEKHGWRVVLTRTNDQEVSPPIRAALADQVQADLYLSLHFVASEDEGISGVETDCVTPVNLPSNRPHGYLDNVTDAFPNNEFDADNLGSAFLLQRSLVSFLNVPDRGVRRTRFPGVLPNQCRPAVVIVGGYLSNPADARGISNPTYRERLAEAVASALK